MMSNNSTLGAGEHAEVEEYAYRVLQAPLLPARGSSHPGGCSGLTSERIPINLQHGFWKSK